MTAENEYFYIFTDVFFVKGYTRTMICDLSKHKWEFVDNSYYDLTRLFRKYKIADITNFYLEKDSIQDFEKFINFLIENDYGTYVREIENFPEIEKKWDSPFLITNAILDINQNSNHNYGKISLELNSVSCEHLQIRSYVFLGYNELENIIDHFSNKDFKSIHIITKYKDSFDYKFYYKFLQKHPSVSFTIHSATFEKFYESSLNNLLPSMGYIQFLKQEIDSCQSCGIINKYTINIPHNIQSFMEGIKYNSCLNRKISIDWDGSIKNCPSMERSFGNINDKPLKKILKNPTYKEVSEINKDQIDICKDCEYRYVCSDCRAYLQEPDNIYSKPSKCSYNPYKGIWDTSKEIS